MHSVLSNTKYILSRGKTKRETKLSKAERKKNKGKQRGEISRAKNKNKKKKTRKVTTLTTQKQQAVTPFLRKNVIPIFRHKNTNIGAI
jgi:hypothetical protein